jgi:hypothetical protein
LLLFPLLFVLLLVVVVVVVVVELLLFELAPLETSAVGLFNGCGAIENRPAFGFEVVLLAAVDCAGVAAGATVAGGAVAAEPAPVLTGSDMAEGARDRKGRAGRGVMQFSGKEDVSGAAAAAAD